MPDPDVLFDVLRRFARTMSGGYDLTDALYEICDQVTDLLGAAGAGVALLDEHGALRFVTATDEAVLAAEQAQERSQGGGPCRAAIEAGEPVAIRDVRGHAEEWPGYCDTVAGLGFVAVLGLPMGIDGTRIGSVDVYDQAREWSDSDVAAASLLAEMASAYVLNAGEIDRSRRTAEQLQTAFDTRVVIEQAKGMLVGRSELSMDDAFNTIRRHARSTQATVRSVAAAIVAGDLDLIDELR